MARDLLNAIALGISMLAGGIVTAFCCINPLAHGPGTLEANIATFFVGMAVGGGAWKLWQNRKRFIPPQNPS